MVAPSLTGCAPPTHSALAPHSTHTHPTRSKWVTDWVKRLDPKASDELLVLARGGWWGGVGCRVMVAYGVVCGACAAPHCSADAL